MDFRPLQVLWMMGLLLAGAACTGTSDDDDTSSDDADGDGVPSDTDCDDHNAYISPGAVEVCDGFDNDCDASIDEGFDFDLDGYFTAADPGCLAAYGQGDCADGDATIHPGASEVCNNIDDDCNGIPDDVPDGDVDGYTACQGDCDDNATSVHPGANEQCDGRDNDCNNIIDDGYDDDADGVSACNGDCDDEDENVFPGAPEVCDEIDNDCDSVIDPGFDADGDGWTTCGGDCDDEDSERYPGAGEVCNDVDDDCDGASDDGFDLDEDGYLACGDPPDCNDLDPAVRPGGVEVCDYQDNDCDGEIDENGAEDLDGDGYNTCQGDCNEADSSVNPGELEICNGRDDDCDAGTSELADNDGDGVNVCGGDCNGEDDRVYPGATEVCDGLDDDCDGVVPPEEADEDEDGYPACGSDCDDEDGTRYPGATEDAENGVDDDCDGTVDEVVTVSGYAVATYGLAAGDPVVQIYSTAGTLLASQSYAGGSFPQGIDATPWGTYLVLTDGDFWDVDVDGGTAELFPVMGMGGDVAVSFAFLPDGTVAVVSETSVYLMDDSGHATLLTDDGPFTAMVEVEADIDGNILVGDSSSSDIYEVDRVTGLSTLRTPEPLWSSLKTFGVFPDGTIALVGLTESLTRGLYRVAADGSSSSVTNLSETVGVSDVEINPLTLDYVITDPTHTFFWGAIVVVAPDGTQTVLVNSINLGMPYAVTMAP